LIGLECAQLIYSEEEKEKELFTRFIEIMQELNIENNYFENIKRMNYEDKMKFDYIWRQYLFLLEELKQEVGSNELFLFSILTGRINTAKVLWKRGKVRSFKIYLLFLYLIFLQNPILLALVAAKILNRFADEDKDYFRIHIEKMKTILKYTTRMPSLLNFRKFNHQSKSMIYL
jgi:hypothetical protein